MNKNIKIKFLLSIFILSVTNGNFLQGSSAKTTNTVTLSTKNIQFVNGEVNSIYG